MQEPLFYLGCPIWACSRWNGNLFTQRATRSDWLPQYSQVFNTVEGNCTFYGLPSAEVVTRWAEATAAPFQFALKFPQSISHQHRLIGVEPETESFLSLLEILKDAGRLGPTFLQLPSGFSPYHLDDMAKYLGQLPVGYPFAVEVRHHDFFDEGKNERALNQVLTEMQVDRVIFDSRPLFSGPPEDEYEVTSQSRKPRIPVHTKVTGYHPMVRLVGRNDVQRVIPWLREWAHVVTGWISNGLKPYVFIHTPDDLFAPQLARMFHEELSRHTKRIGHMARWPGETDSGQRRQLALFE